MTQQMWPLANGICEITLFPLEKTPIGRKNNSFADSEAKNRKDATRALRRILNHNFRAGVDFYLTLDYTPEIFDNFPTDPMELYNMADNLAVNYLRRCRRVCNAQHIPFRYILVTSCMDGKTGEIVRVHHHLVVNSEAASICAEQWKAGGSMPRKLYGSTGGDLSPLAEYMIAQTPSFHGKKKRYHPSRSLVLPEPCDRHEIEPGEAIAIPPGHKIIWKSDSPPGHPQVVRCMAAE